MRVLSLWLPNLATDRLRGSDKAGPIATFVSERGALRLAAVCPAAARAGLRVGMMLTDARAMLPDLAVHPAAPEAEAELLDRLASWCERYTPHVAIDRSHGHGGALWLDITGCAHLFGGEAALRRDLLARLERRASMRAPRSPTVRGPPGRWRALARTAMTTRSRSPAAAGRHSVRCRSERCAWHRSRPPCWSGWAWPRSRASTPCRARRWWRASARRSPPGSTRRWGWPVSRSRRARLCPPIAPSWVSPSRSCTARRCCPWPAGCCNSFAAAWRRRARAQGGWCWPSTGSTTARPASRSAPAAPAAIRASWPGCSRRSSSRSTPASASSARSSRPGWSSPSCRSRSPGARWGRATSTRRATWRRWSIG